MRKLGISLPFAWAAPIFEAVILPAHAATVGGRSEVADCYETTQKKLFSVARPVSGVSGEVTFHNGGGSTGESFSVPSAVAQTLEEGIMAWGEGPPEFNLESLIVGRDCPFWFED